MCANRRTDLRLNHWTIQPEATIQMRMRCFGDGASRKVRTTESRHLGRNVVSLTAPAFRRLNSKRMLSVEHSFYRRAKGEGLFPLLSSSGKGQWNREWWVE